jgi:hypothetical protein
MSPARKTCSHCGAPIPYDRGLLFPGEARIARAIMAFRAPNGTCLVSITKVATYVGLNRGPVRNTIARLVEKGYFEVVKVGSSTNGPTRYRPLKEVR